MRCLKNDVNLCFRDDSICKALPRILVGLFLITFGAQKVYGDRSRHTGLNLPVFRDTGTNFTYPEGNTAVIHCAIDNLGARKVIWRKASDPSPLTVGEMTFVADDRFQVNHEQTKNQWNLFIKDIKHSDAGIYECQVSSKEKYIRKLFRLNVIDRVYGGRDMQLVGTDKVESGDTILLSCNATEGNSAPHSIDWLKDGRKLVTNKSRRVNITIHISYVFMTISSNLTIKNAHSSDEGTYLCRTSDDMIRNVTVTVADNTGSENVKRTVPLDSQPSTSGASLCRDIVFHVISFSAHTSAVIFTVLIILTFHSFLT